MSYKTAVWLTMLLLVAGCGNSKNPNTDSTSDMGSDTDADTDSDSDSDGDTDSDTDGDGDSDADADSDTDGDGDADTDGDTDADSDMDTDSDTDADGDTGSGVDSNTDLGTDSTSDTDTATTSDENPDGQPFRGIGNSRADEMAVYKVSWCYNWMHYPQQTDCDDPLFVPMIWGKDDVAGKYAQIVDAGYKVVLGFNEPNKTDQASMTVEEAIALWPLLTADPSVRVGSPAVSDNGRGWLEDFMTQADANHLRVDFITVHWYGWNAGSCDNANQLSGALNWAEQWGRPLWLTEFGCMNASNPDEQTVMNFFSSALKMFENRTSLERYAWYPWNTYSALSDRGNPPVLTGLGQLFADAPAFR